MSTGNPPSSSLFDRRAERAARRHGAASGSSPTKASTQRSAKPVVAAPARLLANRCCRDLPGSRVSISDRASVLGSIGPIPQSTGASPAPAERGCWLGPASTVQTLFRRQPLVDTGLDAPDNQRAGSGRDNRGHYEPCSLVAGWTALVSLAIAVTESIRRRAWSILSSTAPVSGSSRRTPTPADSWSSIDQAPTIATFARSGRCTRPHSTPVRTRSIGIRSLVERSERPSSVSRSLSDGVAASAHAWCACVPRRRLASLVDSFEALIVYRMLFLLFAEARVSPLWHSIYRDSYSIDSLRTWPSSHGRRRASGIRCKPSRV